MFIRKKKYKRDMGMLTDRLESTKREVDQLKAHQEEFVYYQKVFQRLEEQLGTKSLIGIEENKNKEKQFIFLSHLSNNFTIQAYDGRFRVGSSRIYFRLESTGEIHLPIHTIYIDDIQANPQNRGNGTLLLKYLDLYAKRNNVSQIIGWLSPVDSKRFDKLEKFYKSKGYKVVFDENRDSGRVEKTLKY